jgi:hypothetical protein
MSWHLRGSYVADPPVSVGHHLRGVRDDGHLAARDVGVIHGAFADVEHERDPAEVVGRSVIEGQVARAHQFAGARLYVAANAFGIQYEGKTGLSTSDFSWAA